MEERPRNYITLESTSEEHDEDSGTTKNSKKTKTIAREMSEVFSFSKKEEVAEVKKEQKSQSEQKEKKLEPSIDKNPELETEAPVDHLSEVEIEDISRTLAEVRLREIEPEDLSNQTIVAREFLEEVIKSGDISYSESEIETNPTFNYEESIKVDELAKIGKEVSSKIEHTPPKVIKEKEKPKNQDVSGFLDYLMDRRKNRIKSTKAIKSPNIKVKQLDKRLSNEVKELKQELKVSETRVRDNVETIAKIMSQPEEKENKTRELSIVAEDIETKTEEIRNLMSQNPEELLIENISTDITAKEVPIIDAPVLLMKKKELKAVAKKIKIDGSNLAKIYDSHLITEKGLRRVVSVHLRGGNVKKALNREILQRQIDFERDPLSRDKGGDKGIVTSQADSYINVLLEKKGIDFSRQNQHIETQVKPKKTKLVAVAKSRTSKIRLIDIVLLILILLLAFIALKELI